MSKPAENPERARFVAGSGNVFADLGLPNPEEALARAKLAQTIVETIERRGLSQAEAAQIMGVDQPKVSAIVRGRLRGFTQDRLLRFLTALGNDVEITVRPPEHYADAGRLSVRVA
jgi:predicted XRE-type DNA-binding protein